MKTIAIMQPYFFPYLGYFQLMNAVDEFIIYDNIQYTKKGWINRNRILVNGKDEYITLPLRKDSDYLDINQRYLADIWWERDMLKLENKLANAYRKAPHFSYIYAVVRDCIRLNNPHLNLFAFLLYTLNAIKHYVKIKTPIIISSSLPIDPSLKSEDKVIALCKARQADRYINPIGGLERGLYNKETFKQNNIELLFHKINTISYKQFDNEFISNLSIIDVLMFNSKEKVKELLQEYTLVSNTSS